MHMSEDIYKRAGNSEALCPRLLKPFISQEDVSVFKESEMKRWSYKSLDTRRKQDSVTKGAG